MHALSLWLQSTPSSEFVSVHCINLIHWVSQCHHRDGRFYPLCVCGCLHVSIMCLCVGMCAKATSLDFTTFLTLSILIELYLFTAWLFLSRYPVY